MYSRVSFKITSTITDTGVCIFLKNNFLLYNMCYWYVHTRIHVCMYSTAGTLRTQCCPHPNTQPDTRKPRIGCTELRIAPG